MEKNSAKQSHYDRSPVVMDLEYGASRADETPTESRTRSAVTVAAEGTEVKRRGCEKVLGKYLHPFLWC